MKISDIFRQVADAIDQQADPGQPDDQIQNPAELGPVPSGVAVETDHVPDSYEDDVMIPPLQLKTELLKRAVGVDNVYDPGEPREDQAHDTASQELDRMKQHAGIPVAAVMELDNEELTDD